MTIQHDLARPIDIRDVEIDSGLFGRVARIMREYVIPYAWANRGENEMTVWVHELELSPYQKEV